MTRQEILQFAMGIRSGMPQEHVEWLLDTALRYTAPAVWLEVGCWFGRGIAVAMLALPRGSRVIAVDDFEGERDHYAGTYHIVRDEGRESIVAGFLETIRVVGTLRPGNEVELTLIEKPSVVGAADVADGSCDMVFIDATHTPEAVAEDVRAWAPKVKPDGMLAGHDYDMPRVQEGLATAGVECDGACERNCIWIARAFGPSRTFGGVVDPPPKRRKRT